MAAVESIPQYWAVGVGTGQYWKEWAMQNGFGRQTPFGPAVVGPHNGFLTAWIFFGLPGLVLLCLICFFAARNCPKRDNKSLESVVLFGLLGLGFIWIMFTHTLYLKSFAVILGLLMGVSIKRANNRMTRGSRPLRSIPIGANNIEPPPLRRRPY